MESNNPTMKAAKDPKEDQGVTREWGDAAHSLAPKSLPCGTWVITAEAVPTGIAARAVGSLRLYAVGNRQPREGGAWSGRLMTDSC